MKKYISLLLGLSLLAPSCSSTKPAAGSGMRVYALRLRPGQDLQQELWKFTAEKQLKAGFIMTCVGSLKQTELRLANQPGYSKFSGHQEIVSLVGTLSTHGSHVHLSVSDSTGKTIGGHLVEGCKIYTTAEIVIGEATDLTFKREIDPQTTYDELCVYED